VLLPRLPQKDSSDTCKVESSHEVYVQDFGVPWVVFDALDIRAWVEPVALLEDTGTRDGVVNAAELVMCLLEELVDVVVLGHIAFHESGRCAYFASSGDIDISEDHGRAMLYKELYGSSSNAG
jgi:hypothetical protein